MRRIVMTSLVIAASVAASALAQVTPLPEPFAGAVWDMQPDGRDYARHYPPAAMHQTIQGAAIVCCVAREDRGLNCRSVFEFPEGHGFGAASELITREFRLSEESYAAYRQNPGNWIRRTIIWSIVGADSPQYSGARELISEIAQQACVPAQSAETTSP